MRPLPKHILLISVLSAVLLLLWLTGLGCPFRALFGIPCPTCGMTRALLSLLRLDLAGYARYNIMALPAALAVLAGLHRKRLRISRRVLDAFLILTASLTFALYIVRLIFG